MNKDWLDIGVLEDYLDGKLDAKTMNRVEREALEDPFVAEALAGLSESPKRALQSMSLLQKQLHERIAEHKSVKKTSFITWQRLSIGAAAAVMFVAVSIMFWMQENNQQKELAGRPKKVDVMIAPTVPAEERAVVQAAPVIGGESTEAIEKEIDKAVMVAKTNTYAARVKPEKIEALPKSNPKSFVEVRKPVNASFAPDSLSLNEIVLANNFTPRREIKDSGRLIAATKNKAANIRIRGMSTLENNVSLVSNPVGGWPKLWEYIAQNNAFKNEEKIGQRVEVSFKINEDGTPTDLKIEKGADAKYEQEAIRLIINGSKWEVPEKLNSRMTFKIDF